MEELTNDRKRIQKIFQKTTVEAPLYKTIESVIEASHSEVIIIEREVTHNENLVAKKETIKIIYKFHVTSLKSQEDGECTNSSTIL